MQPPRLSLGLLIFPLACFLAGFQPECLAAVVKKKAPASTRKSVTKSASKGAGKGSKKGQGRKSAKGRKGGPKRAARQQQPDAERVREIQEALAARGYPVEPNGVWGPSSVDALKKFQTDQNIENLSGRGKLDSLTLIALGLGPKREPLPGPGQVQKRSPEGQFP